MKVLLISANTERLNMPTLPLGLAMVSAAARRAGHEVQFLDLMFTDDPRSAIRRAVSELQPEVMGISVRNIDDQDMESPRFLLEQVGLVIEACRGCSDVPIVVGGAGYSIFPREALSYLGADLGVWGDGEVVFPALLERLQSGKDPLGLPGVLVKGGESPAGRKLPRDLDGLPLPGEELWARLDPSTPDLWIPLQSRRGCPNNCSYCSTALIQGRTIRRRSPHQVVDHIERMVQAGFRRFYFVDNSFNIPEAHGREICDAISSRGLDIEWRCILYPERVGEAFVQALKGAGCVEVALGFESGCERILREMNKRFSPGDVRQVSSMLARHGIRRMGFLLLGGPGETRETVEESLLFAQSLDLDGLRTTIGIRIYPGTTLARTAIAEGVLESEDDLLFPRFYLAPGLAPWIHQRVKAGLVFPAK